MTTTSAKRRSTLELILCLVLTMNEHWGPEHGRHEVEDEVDTVWRNESCRSKRNQTDFVIAHKRTASRRMERMLYENDLHDNALVLAIALIETARRRRKRRRTEENVASAWVPVAKQSVRAFENLVEPPKRHVRTLTACGRCPEAHACLLKKRGQGTAKVSIQCKKFNNTKGDSNASRPSK